jgi:transposase-like protein
MGKRHSPQQIVLKLRQADEKLASGASLQEVTRELEISQATYHRWRSRYGGMNLSESKRLKELEKENARLKRLV